MEFGARTATGEPISDAVFDVTVATPGGTLANATPRQDGSRSFAKFTDTQTPGDYWVRVSAKRGGQPVGFDAVTRFVVDARDLELDNPAADPDLLREIAALSGGELVPSEQLPVLIERLAAAKPNNLDQVRTITLWDNWWLLLTYVALQTAEWTLRKKWQLV